MGQTPPPWHGQAVATQILFDHDWPGFEVHRLRMEFSEEMVEVGRFQWKKIRLLYQLIQKARKILRENPDCILFYPPASAKWVPFLRDVIFLASVRSLAGGTVFIYHASGLPVFASKSWFRRVLARLAYFRADVSLEVAQETIPPHQVFAAKSWQWCPCAIEVPDFIPVPRAADGPLIVLFVASLQEGKGVIEILRTASLLKHQGRERDFRFRIVGKWFSHEFEQDARHLQQELELEEMVDFAGQLTGDDKWRAYAEADVFFFPTHYASEATPIVLMEALGMGLPIVSTQWAGIPAMLNGCKTAWLLPVRSPEQYAVTLVDLYQRRDQLGAMQQASCAFYQEHFLPERFVERVRKAFLAVAQPSSRNAYPTGEIAGDVTSPALDSSSIRPHPRPPGDDTSSASTISITAYLADQNPGHDRSFGISRMSQVVLDALQAMGLVEFHVIASKTSQQAPGSVKSAQILPWGTRRKWVRFLTDHFHPLFHRQHAKPDLYYFPKGYLPLLSKFCQPSVVTIHDTIIQYDEDHYPRWRYRWEYTYWSMMLRHTLRRANRILTVSESSKRQILQFMDRHQIQAKEITVTYEPCLYESVPQPHEPAKENFVIHLASCEPHKRTAHLIRWWHEAEHKHLDLPTLHLIGNVPREVAPLLASARNIVKRPFLADAELQAAYLSARALILPSEIEGFGLPALEAYYLGTPVCYIQGTSVEEILHAATTKGGFSLENPQSLIAALDEVTSMSPQEVRACGLKLREIYAADKVAARMLSVFRTM